MVLQIAIVGLQGGVEEHAYMVQRSCRELGYDCRVLVAKKPIHLEDADALVLPGGESTTMGRLASRTGLLGKLRETISSGVPVLGTCAGAILLAKRVVDRAVGETSQPILGLMDVEVVRNYFGRQRESFEIDLHLEYPGLNDKPFRGVFIRAPAITRYWGSTKPLARLQTSNGKVVVAAIEDNMLVTVFHPELTDDTRIHRLLIEMAKK